MKRKKLFIALSIFLAFFVIGAGSFYFFGKDIQKFFGPKEVNTPGGAIAKNEPIVTCGAGDAACSAKNEKILANRIEGTAVEYAKHQCDGPRACPTPNEEESKTIIAAIRAYAKDPKVDLVRINGINATGTIYYCAKDTRCWGYNTKDKKVTFVDDTSKESTSSASATESKENRP